MVKTGWQGYTIVCLGDATPTMRNVMESLTVKTGQMSRTVSNGLMGCLAQNFTACLIMLNMQPMWVM